MSVLCPFCEGQGEVYRVMIEKTRETVFLCGECDSLWLTEEICEDKASNFEDYMLKRGFEPIWSELNYIEKL